jgi:glycosyltransferase involved in cell wall biosynthesis
MTGISIVIITYNRCEELKITLTSLTKQNANILWK